MVGQSQLPATPFLERIYSEDGAELFMIVDESGEFALHATVTGKVTHNRLKHFDEIFIAVIRGLLERGLDHVVAWVPAHSQGNLNFVEYFGFEPLESLKVVPSPNGGQVVLREFIYIFPEVTNEENV